MNYEKIGQDLRPSYKEEEVSIFLNYLKQLETSKSRQGQLTNPWFKYFTEEQAKVLFKKVAIDGLYIDGETITITNKGKVMVSYNYQAYKNKLLMVYPDARFDIQNVYQADEFDFRKEDGKVNYTHKIVDPFNDDKEIIGCYCIIKIPSRGEFIETLNMKEINKMRNVAKTQNIWEAWFSEMTLKSVIKRACKRHFKDVVVNIEKLDNENYDTEAVNLSFDYTEGINNSKTIAELNQYYKDNISKVEDEPSFLKKLTERKLEINK